MSILTDSLRSLAAERLAGLVEPVVLRLAGAGGPGAIGQAYEGLRQLATELVALNPLLSFVEGAGATLAPSLTLLDAEGHETGIRFVGMPLGQELFVLLHDLLNVSRGVTSLSPLGRSSVGELSGELLVFMTPGCSRCSSAVRLAHELALERNRGLATPALVATAVDVTLHPQLVTQHRAMTVPFFVFGERSFPGPLPELVLIQMLKEQ